MIKSLDAKFRLIEELVEQGKAQKAFQEIEQLKLVKEDHIAKFTILRISVLTALNRLDDALNLLTQELLHNINRFGDHLTFIRAITALITAFSNVNRETEAFTIIKKGEDVLNAVQEQDKLYKRSCAILFFKKGKLYLKKGVHESAFNYLQLSLELYISLEEKLDVADVLNNIGVLHWSRGELDLGLKCFKESLEIYQEFDKRLLSANSLNNIGLVHSGKGELDQALECYKRSLSIFEELEIADGRADSFNNIGEIFRAKGDLNSALDYYQKSLKINKELDASKSTLATISSNIGSTYFARGDLEQALVFHKQALAMREEFNNPLLISFSLNDLGLLYRSQGNYRKAYNCFEKALVLLSRVKNEIKKSESLFSLIIVTTENDEIQKAKQFLQELSQLQSKKDNRIINQRYRLAKATVLRKSGRLSHKIEAQQLFSEVASEKKIVKHHLTIFAKLNLCSMLLFELQTMEGEEEILAEINKLVNDLLEIAKKQPSYSLLVQTYLLQSKLALLELNVHRAELLLTQARLTAEEKGFQRLKLIASNEGESLRLQLDTWNDLISRNASILERMELAQVNSIIKQMIQRRVEDISALPRFAVDQIKVTLFRMTLSGPEVVLSELLQYTDNEENVLKQMSLFYIVSLGQGQSAEQNTGLFGPLPVPTVTEYCGIVYAFFIKDPEYTDPRCEGITYAVIAFSMPNSVVHFFDKRKEISVIIEKKIKLIKEINEISLEFLQSLKYQVLGLERNEEKHQGN